MKKKRGGNVSRNSDFKAYCHFCGATVGQISDRTEEKVSSIYDCPKCGRRFAFYGLQTPWKIHKCTKRNISLSLYDEDVELSNESKPIPKQVGRGLEKWLK